MGHVLIILLLWGGVASVAGHSRIACPHRFPCSCRPIKLYRYPWVQKAVVENRVDCSSRNLAAVPRLGHLKGYNISSISLQWNHIATIHSDVFINITMHNQDPLTSNQTKNMNAIPVLDISSNPLYSLNGQELEKLTVTNWLVLKMDNCSLREIPIIADSVASKIVRLYLGFNNIRFASRDNFRKFSNLITLDLTSNRFLSVEENAFVGQQHILKELLLQNTDMISFPDKVVNGLRSLELILLGNNAISDLPDFIMDNLTCSYVSIDLHYNNLSTIPRDAFRSWGKLQGLGSDHKSCSLVDLYLMGNHITSLEFLDDPCSLPITNDSRVALDDNPIHCDCDFRNVTAYQVIPTLRGQCASPPLFRGLDIGWHYSRNAYQETRTLPFYASHACGTEYYLDMHYGCSCERWLNSSLFLDAPEECPPSSSSSEHNWNIVLNCLSFMITLKRLVTKTD